MTWAPRFFFSGCEFLSIVWSEGVKIEISDGMKRLGCGTLNPDIASCMVDESVISAASSSLVGL